jgi:hypothetical protein
MSIVLAALLIVVALILPDRESAVAFGMSLREIALASVLLLSAAWIISLFRSGGK